MPTPPECQPIVDAIANLTAQEQAKRDALKALVGVDKWNALEDLGTLRQQLADQQKLLADCEKQHATDLTTTVVVTDVTGNAGPNRIARVWQLTASGQAVKQTVTLQDGVANFTGVLDSSRQGIGITIEGVDHPAVNGPDFRSGPLPAKAPAGDADPIQRIELVILNPMVLTGEALNPALPALPITMSFAADPLGTVNISIANLQVVVNDGSVSLSAEGTASAAGALPFQTAQSSPFTFAQTLHIAAAFSMTPGNVIEVSPVTAPTLTMPGLIGSVVQALTPLLSSRLFDMASRPIASVLNNLIVSRVAASLGLTALPSGAVLSVRQLVADGASIQIMPVLGAFGTVLSDFQPPALDAINRLVGLDVQPATINTGDPSQRVAQGRVTIDTAAPAGGVTVQISSDRNDILQIAPTAVVIPEGDTAGSFTVIGSPLPLMSSSQVDATVRASLGTQTLTAPLSIKPENPPTATAAPSAPVSPPSRSAIGVGSIDLYTSPPLPRGQTIQGRIMLDGLPGFVTTIVTVTLTPAVGPPIGLEIPAGFYEGYFTFTIASGFPGNTLRITATTGMGADKSIDVAVAN